MVRPAAVRRRARPAVADSGRRVGVEINRVAAPRRTRSMTVALNDLRLNALYVVYPGDGPYVIDDRIAAVPAGAPFSRLAGAAPDRVAPEKAKIHAAPKANGSASG